MSSQISNVVVAINFASKTYSSPTQALESLSIEALFKLSIIFVQLLVAFVHTAYDVGCDITDHDASAVGGDLVHFAKTAGGFISEAGEVIANDLHPPLGVCYIPEAG